MNSNMTKMDMAVKSMSMPTHHHGGNMNMNKSTMEGMGSMMKMYFHTDKDFYMLFFSWFLNTDAKLIGACFGVFFTAIFYEGLKVFREWLLTTSSTRDEYVVNNRGTDGDTIEHSNNGHHLMTEKPFAQIRRPTIHRQSITNGWHILQSFLHMVQVFISYLLMLIFMTYNIYLCLSLILGAGVGYFLFAWKRAFIYDINEHCH